MAFFTTNIVFTNVCCVPTTSQNTGIHTFKCVVVEHNFYISRNPALQCFYSIFWTHFQCLGDLLIKHRGLFKVAGESVIQCHYKLMCTCYSLSWPVEPWSDSPVKYMELLKHALTFLHQHTHQKPRAGVIDNSGCNAVAYCWQWLGSPITTIHYVTEIKTSSLCHLVFQSLHLSA